jgi:hypothetical protein
MVGLHLLKHIKALSDEQVCAQWVENPYFQAFCGETYFQHELPLERSSMSRWRERIGPDKIETVLAESIAAALKGDAVERKHFERVTIDTTVQTKAVAHPSDSHLLYRGIEWLNRLAKRHGVELRQSFLRLGKYAKREVGRLIHTGGHKQAMRHLRRLKTFLGRLYRDVARKLDAQPVLREICAETMAIVAPPARPEAHRQAQALRVARARGRVHRQGQGQDALGVRRQGKPCGDQRLRSGRPVRARRPRPVPKIPMTATRSRPSSTRSSVSPASRSPAPMSISAIAATTPRPDTPRSTSRANAT